MAYTVFARKYRPQTFADLVGQEHVSRTLGNAIDSGRVAHAFLFTGVRGVGKTSSARILAKCLNCDQGPTLTPCNQCDPCTQITAGVDMDVLEIDGASHNGVDDVRKLQETLPFRPARDRFKVVIVDEVHMLTTGAFNAFLKTLEEPPPHVKFIFATTEIHKVPITIRSRCQRYDFRLIQQATIITRLREILTQEGIGTDDAALAIIAREAAGSMRDALTVLDLVVAFSGGQLTGEQVARGLGIADRKHAFTVAAALIAGDPVACMQVTESLAAQGLDLLHFARELLSLLRDLVVLQVAGEDAAHLDLTQEERADAHAIADGQDGAELQRAFSGVAQLVDEVARSATPKLVLEMGLIRLASRPRLQPIGELIAELRAIGTTGGGGPQGSGQRGGHPSPSGRGPEPRSAGSAPHRAAPAMPVTPTTAAPRTTATAAPAKMIATAPITSAPQNSSGPGLASTRPDAPAGPPSIPATNPSAGVDTNAAVTGEVPTTWRAIVARLMESQPAVGAILQHGAALEVSSALIRIGFPQKSFFGRQAAAEPAREAIAAAAEAVLGVRPNVQVSVVAEADTKLQTMAAQEASARDERERERKQEAMAHPAVRAALKVFPEGEQELSVKVAE